MSNEKIVEMIGRQISRRAFLKKLGASAIATLLALLGFPQTATAHFVHYKCCHLCQSPSSSCSGGCPTPTSAGRWCWVCFYTPTECYLCCECKQAGAPCNGECDSYVYRSWATQVICPTTPS
jgi:hypothetical protein